MNFEDAAAPTWMAFLERVLPDDEVRAFVQRAAGYSITGSIGEEVLLFLHGTGANGKSKFIGALLDLLGTDYSYPAPSEILAVQKNRGHPAEVAALHGMRLVVCNELDAGMRLDEARVKQFTGGDRIATCRKFENWWSFLPTHTLWMVGNYKPRIIGTNEAIWRRVLCVPFNVTIPTEERDCHLAAKLRAELPGILRWAIDGCLAWQRDGLCAPSQVLAASSKYREEQDSLADYLASCTVRLADARASAKQIFESYTVWCNASGEESVSMTLFGTMLRERGFERRLIGGRRFYCGLKVLEVAYEQAEEPTP